MSTLRSPLGKALIGSILLHIILIPLTCSPGASAATQAAPDQLVFVDVAPAPTPAVESEPPPAPAPTPDVESPRPLAAVPKSAPPPAPAAPPAGAVAALTAPDDGKPGGDAIASGDARELRGGAVSAQGTATVAPTAIPPPPAPPAAPSPERLTLARNYLARVRSSLQRMHRYPDAAQRLGLTGAATLAFTIDGNGRFVEVSVVQSTGHAILDQAAEAAVRGLSGRLPRPEDLGDTPLRTTVRLRFDLED